MSSTPVTPHAPPDPPDDAPFVSTVVPTYGRPDLLPRALASIRAQTFTDWEVLVVDDNDPASSARAETRAWVATLDDPRVRYLEHDANRGGSAARNTGIRAARATWVAFLDDDDEWLPDKLAAQVERVAEAGPEVGLVYVGSTAVREDGAAANVKMPSLRGRVYPELLAGNAVGTTSAVLCRRDALVEAGMFDETLGAFQDFDLYLRLARVCTFAAVDIPLVRRHKHAGDRITKSYGHRIAAAEAIFAKHEDVLARHPEIRSAFLTLQGRQQAAAGHRRDAVVTLARAFRASPTRVEIVGHLVLAALGPRIDRAVRRVSRPARRAVGRALRRIRGG